MTTNKDLNGVVILGYGPQPLSFITNSSKFVGDDAVVDPDIARMAGAKFAFGSKALFDELRQRLEMGALIAQRVETPGLSMAATNWLANGRRGRSSETMFTALTGVDVLGGSTGCSPHDPDDFDRCLALLEEVPELRPLLSRMAVVSPEWAALIRAWDEIERVFLDEAGLGWSKSGSAPETYELMRAAFDGIGKPETMHNETVTESEGGHHD